MICNAALIAAVTIAVRPGRVDPKTLKTPVIFFFSAAGVYAAVAYTTGNFSRRVGVLLLGVFAAYMLATVRQIRRAASAPAEGEARELGVPESVIALTFIALGTSLPELVTALTALVKGHGSLSLGNVVGANLLNLVLVCGASMTLAPFRLPQSAVLLGRNAALVLELPVMVLVMLLLTVPALKKGRLYRGQGILLLLVYGLFCAVQFTL